MTPGSTIGKCVVERELGRGGMGVVYLARHTTLDTPVAVKVLPAECARDPEFTSRFLREAKLAAKVRHPNIVSVMDADREGDLYYIVYEYVDGGTVGDLLKRKGKLDEKQARAVVTGVAKALVGAAEHNVVHRDIKPDNIMLAKAGHVKLADLGLAKERLPDATDVTMTQAVMGTPAYMSPEQAEDTKSADARSDIYSLGATLYHLLTGEIPFPAATVYNMMSRLLKDPVPDPRARRPALSPELAAICMKMMAKRPGDRFANAKELLAALKGAPAPPKRARFLWALIAVPLALLAWWLAPDREPPVPPPARVHLYDGVLLALDFDGAAVDLSPHHRSVTVHGSPRFDGALVLDGVDDYLETDPLDERTVSMWIRPDDTQQRGVYDGGAVRRNFHGYEIAVFRPDGIGDGSLDLGSGIFVGHWYLDAMAPVALDDGRPHHVVVAWNGDREVRVVVDGVARSGRIHHVGSFPDSPGTTFTYPVPPTPDPAARTWIGRIRFPIWGNGQEHFAGTIDEVIVWNRPLTDDEIRRVHAHGPGACARIAAREDF